MVAGGDLCDALRAVRDPRELLPIFDRSLPARLAIAVGVASAAIGLRAALDRILGDAIPWVTFFPAVLVSALFAGGLAAIVTLLFCALVGDVLFVPPRGSLAVEGFAGVALLVSFLLNAGLVALVGVAFRRALRGLAVRDERSRRAAEALRAGEAALRAQVDDLTRLHEFATRVVGTHGRDAVLRAAVETTMALQATRRGFVELYDPDANRLVPGVSIGHDANLFRTLANVPVAEGEGACGTAAARRERVIVEDVETDPVFAGYREAARAAGFRAVWSTPLLTTRGVLVGVLSTHFETVRRPTAQEIQLVELYARLAADAIEAATLYEHAEEARRRAEDAVGVVREADRRKDEFLAMLAHELRNPLAPIRNAVAVMRMLEPQEVRLERARDIIDRQLTHLTRLVDDLLEVSRITRGKITLEKRPVSLAEIVEEAVEVARPLIDAHEHTLSVTLGGDDLRLEGDRARLVQVVANLLANAAKFTPRGGHITVETRRSDAGEAVVQVRDTGIGIPAEVQERIFDLFVQEESTLARSQGGLGIGLTLVKRIVELHGGRASVASEGRGRGAEFAVTLPALAPAAPIGKDDGRATRRPAGAVLRVLVVEDNRDTAETFALLLGLDGHDVRVAHHGVQALRLLDEFEPDVAFIDLGLPEMTGFELARRLRADPRTQGIPLIAVTGYGRDEDKEETLAAGFTRHLTKPVSHDVVAALLAALGSPVLPPERSSSLVH